MLETTHTLRRKAQSERIRSHTLHLISLLDSKMDAIARNELYRRISARRAIRGHEAIFDRMIEADRTHVEWLKQQITRGILGA